jgi:type II secretory ATPase GspE/PulE/Tfp pilus assembly ATPase PilB-like protein
VVNRVKVLARMNISEQRRPQDGRFSMTVPGGRSVDLRAVVLPSVWGEEVTLRILDSAAMDVELDRLGLAPPVVGRLADLIDRSNGVVLVTGPTNSGKSTTLYAALRRLARPEVKVLSIEDPVEYRIDGVSQHQVLPRFGFADALRSFLRADPDVIFVGEIRDTETAEMAMNAAMTGHLLLSSFHARSAASAPVRLIEMGIPPYMVSSALSAILGQRLVRELCRHCRVVDDRRLPEDLDWPSGAPPEVVFTAKRGGCPHCEETGYRGRAAIGELVVVDPAIAHAIAGSAPLGEIQRLALAGGTTTLFSDALRSVADGRSSLDEVYRSMREAV